MSSVDIAGDASKKIAFGTHTTVAATDTGIDTGLLTVEGVIVGFSSDMAAVGAGEQGVSAAPSATAGEITIKNWEADGTVGATFGDVLFWFAWGT